MATSILAVTESRDGALRKVSHETVAAARQLAGGLGGGVDAIVFGESAPGGSDQLPADRVLVAAHPDFDARFAALWRRYAYRIADAPALVDPLVRSAVLAWPRPLDLDRMNEASAALVGEHDFAAFCKKREGATTIRALLELSWSRDDAGLAVGTVRA